MSTKEALAEIEKIKTTAKTARVNRREPDPRKLMIGKGVRQGDVYLVRVPDSWVHGEPRKGRQIADGTSIGQRHCIARSSDVTIFEGAPDAAERMYTAGYAERVPLGMSCGPVVVAKGRLLNTHPEHAHYGLPAGTYQVLYQMDESTRQRVLD